MYFVEHGDDGGRRPDRRLRRCRPTSWRRGSRTSCGRPRPTTRCWRRPPTAACSTPTDLRARRSTRLLADPRARPALDEFFADWMKVEDLPALDAKNADPTFKTFAGADLPDAKLRQAMIDDVRRACSTTTPGRSRRASRRCSPAICRSRATRASRKLYGVAAWDGSRGAARAAGGAAPRPADARAVPRRPARANTRPIMKGVFMRTNILCDTIPPPPPGANAKPPELRPEHDDARERRGDHRDAGHDLRRAATARRSTRSASRPRASTRSAASAPRSACSTPAAPRPGTKPVDTMTVPQVVVRRSDRRSRRRPS